MIYRLQTNTSPVRTAQSPRRQLKIGQVMALNWKSITVPQLPKLVVEDLKRIVHISHNVTFAGCYSDFDP